MRFADSFYDSIMDKLFHMSLQPDEMVEFIYIDRGVDNWITFGRELTRVFPRMKSLIIRQNYGSSNRDEFLEFIRMTALSRFELEDQQTGIFDHELLHQWFNALPVYAYHTVEFDHMNLFRKTNVEKY